jgi:hypothetical protein
MLHQVKIKDFGRKGEEFQANSQLISIFPSNFFNLSGKRH